MSLITLLDTKQLVKDSINAVRDLNQAFSNEEKFALPTQVSLKQLAKNDIYTELSNIYELQYNLIYTFYNSKTVQKVCHTKKTNAKLGFKKVLEYYYQHQFLHNTAAILDELYEQKDALDDIKQAEEDNNDEKKYRAFLLFLEESIDVMHFAVEYGCLFAEHYALLNQSEDTVDERTFKFPEILYDNSDFKVFVTDLIKKWCNDINSESEILKSDLGEKMSADESIEENIRQVRTLIRNFAFKDWKVYKDDFYDGDKLVKLFGMSLKIISNLYNLIVFITNKNHNCWKRYMSYVFGVDENSPYFNSSDSDFNKVLISHLAYGCYVAKNWINMQRQQEDPRYTGQDFGRIIGVSIE